jgi:hypothetical protein
MGQGKYGYLTWWEQIDNGKQFTLQRKILTVSPIILCVALLPGTTSFVPRDLIQEWLS